MQYILPSVLLGTILTASLPALFYSATASQKLLQYESATKKAAKVSSEAGHQLRKTRTTQGAAIVSTLVSIGMAGWLLVDLQRIRAEDARIAAFHMKCALVPIVLGGVARVYVSGFWKGAMKAPFPGMTGYNDGVRATESGIWWSGNVLTGWVTYAVYALCFV